MTPVRLLVVVATVAVAAGACSSGTNDSPVAGGGKSSTTATAPGTTVATSAKEACGLSGNVSDHGAKAAGGASASVEAGDFFFSPTCVTSAPAGTVTLTVMNTGQALHNVSVPDQGIDMDVGAGQTITVPIKVGDAVVNFFCKYHRTSGMVGGLAPA
jgi:plastocyanin